MNYKVRDVEQASLTDFDFCSHKFHKLDDGTWRAWLTGYPKMFYSFMSMKSYTIENLQGLAAELEHMPIDLRAKLAQFTLDFMLDGPPSSPFSNGKPE